ncbi:hypothetical protein RKD44_007154 [Streptomyces collinus]
MPARAEHQRLGVGRGTEQGRDGVALADVGGHREAGVPFGDRPDRPGEGVARPALLRLPVHRAGHALPLEPPGVHDVQRGAAADRLPRRPGQCGQALL